MIALALHMQGEFDAAAVHVRETLRLASGPDGYFEAWFGWLARRVFEGADEARSHGRGRLTRV
jgi:hypothetical protein